MKRKKAQRRRSRKRSRKSQEYSDDESVATAAARKYSERNKDIEVAVETMRQTQLIQETRARYLLENLSYQVIGV